LGGARLAAAHEFLRMLARALLEGFTGLWRRQESLIGARGARQCNVERFLVGFVDIDDGAIGDLRRLPVAGGRPVRKEFAIARRRVRAWIHQEISRVDSVPRAELECLWIAAHHPERRMWLLYRLHRKQGAVGAVNFALKGERLRFAIGRPQIVDEFKRRRFAQVVVEAEWLEILRVYPGDEAELHAPADHLVDECDLLSQPQRVVERHDVAHRADADPAGARGRADDVDAGRGNPALVGTEMMLDAEGIVVTKPVAQLK